jgi:hypothetical protein
MAFCAVTEQLSLLHLGPLASRTLFWCLPALRAPFGHSDKIGGYRSLAVLFDGDPFPGFASFRISRVCYVGLYPVRPLSRAGHL